MKWENISWLQYILISLGSIGCFDFTVQMMTDGNVKLIQLGLTTIFK